MTDETTLRLEIKAETFRRELSAMTEKYAGALAEVGVLNVKYTNEKRRADALQAKLEELQPGLAAAPPAANQEAA